MSGPITWRTIMGASPAEAVRPMEVAQRSIGSALDQFGGLIKSAEASNQAVLDRQSDAHVQNFLDRLQHAGSVDELNTLRSSGELDALRSAVAPKDLAKIRGSEDARVTSLMQQAAAKTAFDQQQLAAKYAPIKDKALGMSVAGDKAGALKLLADNPDMPGQSEIYKAIQTDDHSRTSWDQNQKAWTWKEAEQKQTEALRPGQIQAQTLNIEATKANLEASKENRDLAKEQRDQLKAATKIAAEGQFLKDTGNVYADGVFNPNDTQGLQEMMVKAGIGDSTGERLAVIERLSKIANQDLQYMDAEGKVKTQSVPVPLSLVKQAILGASDQTVNWRTNGLGGSNHWFGWNQGVANNMEDNLRAAMRAGLENKDAPKNQVVKDFEAYMLNKMGAATNPAPGGGTKKR